jgi:hypothetical protein
VRALLILATWGLATAAALFLAWQTKVGPVVARVSAGHGIHLGDVLAFAIAWSWAAIISVILLSASPRRSSR